MFLSIFRKEQTLTSLHEVLRVFHSNKKVEKYCSIWWI